MSWSQSTCRGGRLGESEKQILHFHGNFRDEGCYEMTEAGLLVCDVMCKELSLNLRGPHFRIRQPEQWVLMDTVETEAGRGRAAEQLWEKKRKSSGSFCHDLLSGSPNMMVRHTKFVPNNC